MLDYVRMHTKLTLRIESAVIDRAKKLAKKNGKSLSQMVSEYFAHLEGPRDSNGKLGPVTRRLKGVLRGSGVDEADYRAYLQKKHR